jgi:hypothetical protein
MTSQMSFMPDGLYLPHHVLNDYLKFVMTLGPLIIFVFYE